MTTIDLSLLLPTRERPERLRRFLDSVYETAQHPNKLEIILFIDDDDDKTTLFEYPKLNVKKIVAPRNTMGYYNTTCLNAATGEITIAVNDDIIIRTPHWDEAVRKLHRSQKDGVYLAYPNDLNKKKGLPTFPILSKKTCELMNRAYPIEYKSSFLDTHLLDVFLRLKKYGKDRLFFLEDIIFEHMHFRNKKAPKDNTYTNRNRFADDDTFIYLKSLRQQQAFYLEKETSSQNEKQPVWIEPPTCEALSKNFPGKVWNYLMIFLFDKTAPLKWRAYLFYYFTARLTYFKLTRLFSAVNPPA